MTGEEMNIAIKDNESLVNADSDEDSDEEGHESDEEGEEMLMGELSSVTKPEVDVRAADIADSVDRLYKLAIKIRSPDGRVIPPKFDLYRHIDPNFKEDYVKTIEEGQKEGIREALRQCRRSIAGKDSIGDHRLTESDEYLVLRLHKANQTRRQQFAYWKHHKEKLIQATLASTRQIFDMSATSTGDPIAATSEPESPIAVKNAIATSARSTGMSMPSAATTLPGGFALDDVKSERSDFTRATTTHGASDEVVEWPPIPRDSAGENEFECPYCFFFCPRQYKQPRYWRFVDCFLTL